MVLLRGVVAYLSSYLMAWVAIRTICDLRARLFEHLLNLPLSFFTGNSTGELISPQQRPSDPAKHDRHLPGHDDSGSLTILTCVNGMLAVDPG